MERVTMAGMVGTRRLVNLLLGREGGVMGFGSHRRQIESYPCSGKHNSASLFSGEWRDGEIRGRLCLLA